MANELTRKGIAFGAAVALGSTLIVGGAANAAPNVNYQDLELNVADFGNSNGVLATTSVNYFGLVLSWNGDVNTQNFDNLEYNWSWADADTEDGTGYGWFGSTGAYYDTYEDQVVANYYEDGCWSDYTGWEAPHAGGNFTDTEDEGGVGYTGPVGDWDATSSFGRDEDGALSYWGAPFIQFGTCYTPDEKAVVTVQAFIDTNNNDTIDGTETHSAPVEVTFWNPHALEVELALDNDGVVYSTDGEDSIGYEISVTTPLNNNWTEDSDDSEDNGVYGDYYVESYVDGESYDEDSVYFYWTEDSEDDTLYDEDSIDYDVTDGVEDLGSSVTQVRVAVYNEETDEYAFTAWQNVTVMEPQVEYTDNYVTEAEYVAAEDEDAIIREDVTSVEYNVEFLDSEDAGVAGVDGTAWVYFYGTEEDLAGYGLTVGGDDEAEEVDTDVWEFEVAGTSNADGVMAFDIDVENPDEDLYLGVEYVEYEGTGNELDGDLNWDVTAYDLVAESALEYDETYTAPVGGSFDFTMYVVDQWYNAPDQDVRLQWYSNNRDGWDYKYFDVKSDGSVEISLTDGAPADGEETDTYYYVNEVQVKDGSAWETGNFDWDGDYYLYIDWLTDQAEVDYVTADFYEEDGQAGISNGDFIETNLVYDRDYADDHWDADNDYEWIEGYVHAADGYTIGGAAVTISGSGLLFDDYYYGNEIAQDSITVRADEDGYYGLYVVGHKVGEHTVTVSSEGKSTTATLLLDDRNLYGSAVAVSPFTGKAGTSEMITATVTDRFGNLVPEADVTFSVVGGGYFVDDVDSTGGDSSDYAIEDVAAAGYGQASEMLVILSNEVGYGSTVTATIDVVDPYGEEEDTTASASLAAGATDFGKPAFWTKDLGDGTLKLYAKNIVGAGKIQFFHNGKEIAWIKAVDALDPKLRAANGSYYLVRTVKLVSGKNVLEIKDDGVRVVRRVASK